MVEVIKDIFFKIKESYNLPHIIIIVLDIISSILSAIYYLYIKRLMEYKYISPDKCNFMIGIIIVPLIILIYFSISFTSLGNIKNKFYYDNIFELFKSFGKIDAKDVIFLISLPFAFGIMVFIINKTINYFIHHDYFIIIKLIKVSS